MPHPGAFVVGEPDALEMHQFRDSIQAEMLGHRNGGTGLEGAYDAALDHARALDRSEQAGQRSERDP